MAYTNWKKTQKRLGALFLDPENPRIPPTGKPLSQPELITELVQHDDVEELASNIKVNGFFPTEPLVVVKEKGKHIVVEGNRRLAACKLLVNPELAPPEFLSKFRALSTSVQPGVFNAIPVVIAPDRDSTIPVIIARHTSTQIQRWETAMQANFYRKLVNSGLSVAQIAAKFNLSVAEIKEALRDANLYQMACRLPLSAPVRDVVRDPRKFKLTNLSRIFESPTGREFFGVGFADDGTVVGKVAEKEFKKGFTKVVTDIATGDADSRTLNSPAEIKAYLGKFSATQKPDLSSKGSFDSSTFLVSSGGAAVAPIVPPRRPRTGSGSSKGLIPKSFVCNLTNRRVKEVLTELKSLKLKKYPNAAALSFRCFLELSVYLFLNEKGEIAKMVTEERAKIKAKNQKLPAGKSPVVMAPHWNPTLAEMLHRVVDPSLNLLQNAQVAKAMAKTLKDEQSLFELNLYTHNPSYHPSETRLRESWKNFEDFLTLIAA